MEVRPVMESCDLEEARTLGVMEGKAVVALNLLNRGFEPVLVSEVTELTLDTIYELRNKNAS